MAIKVFRLDLTPEQSAALVAEFERLVAKGIRHSSIAAPIATGLESGAAFLAQEYVVGESLDVVLRERGALPLAEAVHLAESIAAGIDAAAAAGVTHGSLHPRDIILAGEDGDSARITGIGIADALASIGARVPFRSPYSAQDNPSDGYSVAAITFEALSGRRLSEANLDELEHERGHELRSVFASAVAPNPVLRPAHAGDFASAVREAVGHMAPAVPAATAASAMFESDRATAPLESSVATPQIAERGLADNPFDHFVDPGAAADLRVDFPLETEPADQFFDRLDSDREPDIEPLLNQEPEPLAQPVPERYAEREPKREQEREPERHAERESERQPGPEPELLLEPERATPFAASWNAEQPKMFQAEEPVDEPVDEPVHEDGGRRRLFSILLICVLVVVAVFAYFIITGRRSTNPAAVAGTKPSVSETTVELPTSRQPTPSPNPPPMPAETRENRPTSTPPPAPSPSRSAAGVTRKPLAPSSAAAPHGNLLIRSTPPNADVVVNGQSRGKTPLTMRDLPLGSYTIRIAREGYAPEERRVELTSQRATAAMSFSLQSAIGASAPASSARGSATGPGSINVQSRPSGARVFVNDQLMGSTPLAIPNMPEGSAAVRIEMDGYQPWTSTVHVNAGEPARVNASLDRR